MTDPVAEIAALRRRLADLESLANRRPGLTREAIERMSPAEMSARSGEIDEFLAGPRRPDTRGSGPGGRLTLGDIKSMPAEEIARRSHEIDLALGDAS